MALSLLELRALALRAGFPPGVIDTAAAIAMAESGGNPAAVGDPTLGTSIGLWQINLAAHPQMASWALTDPLTNAQAALIIAQGGRTFSPWSTYTQAPYPYRKYLPAAGYGIGAALVALSAGALVATRARHGPLRVPGL